ncbi:MAG: GIY-YIG nuclease family protein [Novosphingobium sp.]
MRDASKETSNFDQTFVIPAKAGTHLRASPMHENFSPVVYLLASHRNGTLYIGVTSDLMRRLQQHRERSLPGFSKEHGVMRLVWFERHATMETAIVREKRLKKWNRAWKVRLIEESNPDWDDLALELGFAALPSRRVHEG